MLFTFGSIPFHCLFDNQYFIKFCCNHYLHILYTVHSKLNMLLDKFLIFNLDAGTDPVSFLLEKKKKKSTSIFSSLLIKKKKKILPFGKGL